MKCRICGVEKPEESFHLRKTGTLRRECKSCTSALQTMRRFNLSFSRLLLLEHAVEGKCQICGKKPEDICDRNSRLAVDHNHRTGHLRGMLCTNCNTAIGLMDDDPIRLTRAAAYVRGEIPTPLQVILAKALEGLDNHG